MKKLQPAQRSPAAKRSASPKTPKTADEYLAAVPEPARSTLKKVRAAIRAAAPAEAREVISYGMPTFQYRGMLIAFAAFPKHCSLFLATPSLLKNVQDRAVALRNLKKASIRFPHRQTTSRQPHLKDRQKLG